MFPTLVSVLKAQYMFLIVCFNTKKSEMEHEVGLQSYNTLKKKLKNREAKGRKACPGSSGRPLCKSVRFRLDLLFCLACKICSWTVTSECVRAVNDIDRIRKIRHDGKHRLIGCGGVLCLPSESEIDLEPCVACCGVRSRE